ncbi:recombinase family protein [Hoeflea sp. G2-23]|uniref:Recombinase family protein n=1 Tax=Hoeflea algicola TaxID=2983763 RepID=A0ABT3Z4Q5_9HYPH|nr:recombinase family protein [Hoeflea algicola]MCY0146717.1 recombinase family protein [Hoeflea algicola]
MKIGYARVSTKWYQSKVQLAQLEGQGCAKVWSEENFSHDGPDDGFERFLAEVSPGDTVVTTRLASLADSAPDLLRLLEKIHRKGAYFRSLAEPWADTTSEGGDRVIETVRGLIEFEIAVADVKSRDDQDRPKTFGVSAGRPQKLSNHQKQKALSLLKVGKSAAAIGRMLGVSRSTISRLKSEKAAATE